MKQKRRGSSVRGRQAAKNAKVTPDKKIDFSDIAEATDLQLTEARNARKARKVGRPKKDQVKQLIAIRLEARLLSQLKKLGARQNIPYQTLIHDFLEKAVNDK